MLVVRVELHSAIDGSVTEIANMVIHNNGKAGHYDDPHAFDYKGLIFKDGQLWDDGRSMAAQTDNIAGVASVTNFPQRDKDGKFTPVWHLISDILEAASYGWPWVKR